MSGDHNANQKPKTRASKGLFDDVPIVNPERDKAWAALIKRKDMKALMKDSENFKFPLDGSYDLWCIAWSKAWDAGFAAGYDKEEKQLSKISVRNKRPLLTEVTEAQIAHAKALIDAALLSSDPGVLKQRGKKGKK